MVDRLTKAVYQEIKSKLDDNQAVFILVSGSTEVVELCQSELGIRAYLKDSELSDFLGKL